MIEMILYTIKILIMAPLIFYILMTPLYIIKYTIRWIL